MKMNYESGRWIYCKVHKNCFYVRKTNKDISKINCGAFLRWMSTDLVRTWFCLQTWFSRTSPMFKKRRHRICSKLTSIHNQISCPNLRYLRLHIRYTILLENLIDNVLVLQKLSVTFSQSLHISPRLSSETKDLIIWPTFPMN